MKEDANRTERNLTDKKMRAIPLILGAKSISEGIDKAKISRTTFYEWMKSSEFKSEFVKQRNEIVNLALHELKTSAGEAVAVMRKLLASRNESIRLRTAQGMIENLLKSIQLEELEQRITALERKSRK